MSARVVSDLKQRAPRRPRSRRWRWVWIALGAVVGLAVVFTLAGALGLAIFHAREGRDVPTFESLSEHPDRSLQGTVAYSTGESRCVRIVAAAGGPSKDVLCLDPWQPDPARAMTEGKEMTAPQLVWRVDGRLEITVFRMLVGPATKGERPTYKAGWQRIVDVRTGKVEEVPAADLPPAPNLTTRPTSSPGGQRLTWESNGMTGQVKVTVTDATGPRTLLSAHGPGEYTYALYSVFWAPDWQWVAVDDGRILVITPGDHPVTRVLVDGGGGWGEFPTFAVTAENILAAPEQEG